MTTTLLSVGAKTPEEDEHQIAHGYRKSWQMIFGAACVLGLTAHFGDMKEVIAAGALLTVWAVVNAEARLYDLCIRMRRTNFLLCEPNLN